MLHQKGATQFSWEDLPEIVTTKILDYLSYDQVSKMREVSKNFDTMCKNQLNHGYRKVFALISRHHSNVEKKLPRRQSLKFKHPMHSGCSGLSCLKSCLQVRFGSFERWEGLCFFPGKLLDEVLSAFRKIKSANFTKIRYLDITREVWDLKNLAGDHFRDKIEPGLKESVEKSSIAPLQSLKNQDCCNAKKITALQRKSKKQAKIIKHQSAIIDKHEKDIASLKELVDKFVNNGAQELSSSKQVTESEAKRRKKG